MVGLQEIRFLRVTYQDGCFFVNVTSSKLIDEIFTEASKECGHPADDIELAYKGDGKEITHLSNLRNFTLGEAKLWSIPDIEDFELVLTITKNLSLSDVSEDELMLGASASPTAGEAALPAAVNQEEYPTVSFNQAELVRTRRKFIRPVVVETSNYVGLVNQAMTCYLNSLLQALYMTPEFRNALYNWEFDGANETRSIPYQLQRLFLNLQTSSKSAVETTDLTTSFGWQGSDAWHQHDIQELCRVMFDALEQKFKDTKQANLINDLYEGKMQDYVKCLECGTEKCREDTFLDIPLPVRPFGSTVAYNSVEEALRAFVQPETLDGNNQYFCEKCNKKCDAHKGLKFSQFPYLLTLHLKRFDFDYNTMHRIKLNDKVVFSEKLNLNSFILNKCEQDHMQDGETVVKCDDCSTTDSGAADDESCQGTDLSLAANGQDDNCADSDEGIDVSSGNNPNENEAKGPYIYELFSIMIHSGSASGGHYYAYIKDFDKNLWFCFNDQNVSPITEDDIEKTYGGGTQRPYYSASYSSSINAYMLMYRQIDKERNCRAMSVSDFPPHLQRLLANMRKKEEEDRINKKKEDDMVKLNVWCEHPKNGLHDLKISSFTDSTLSELTQHCYNRFKLDNLVSVEDCRMVSYNKQYKCINCSFDSDDLTVGDTMSKHSLFYEDWMLDIREPTTEWRTYRKGGINVKVYPIVLESEDVDEPKLVRVDVDQTVQQLKQELEMVLQTESCHLKIALNHHDVKFYKSDDEIIQFDPKGYDYRLYVTNAIDQTPESAKKNHNKFKKLIDQYSYIISITIVLPDTDEATLESLSIPSLDSQDKVEVNGRNSPRASPQPMGGMSGDGYDQSNSEDSSLSDSDRTLIGDAPGLSGDNSPGLDDHLVAPPDPCNEEVAGKMAHIMNWDDSENHMDVDKDQPNYYFKITSVISNSGPNVDEGISRQCKVLVDKRMTLETLKKHLESIVRVPSEYFKVFRRHHLEDEWSRLKDTLRSLSDGARIALKLGRVLKEGEQQCKVYYLNPDSMDTTTVLMEHIISKNQTVESAKKEILEVAKNLKNLNIPYNRCRLREKNWKKPRKVFLDDQKFGEEITLSSNFEMYLQELKEPETVTSNNQVVVFLRKFSPSELTLGPFQEVVLDLLTMDYLLKKVSDISEIPIENLDVGNVKGSYPYDMHILEIQDELDWNPKLSSLEHWPLNVEDGSMFFYRDNREVPKELTLEEKREIRQKEDARLGRRRPYSPCRERALKIYLDSSPSRMENAID